MQMMESILAASLKASEDLAASAGQGPAERIERLGERHKLITGLQASAWGRTMHQGAAARGGVAGAGCCRMQARTGDDL